LRIKSQFVNLRSFGKHKRKLDTIYSSLDKKSEEQLGLKNNTKLYASILNNNITLTKQFKESEKNITINKDNNLLFQKINTIQKRENVNLEYLSKKFHQIVNDHKAQVDYIRNRTNKLKNNENSNINKMNSFLGSRIFNKSSYLSFKKMDEDFSKTQYYKNFSRKFHLPDISKKGYKSCKKSKAMAKLDTSTYVRKIEPDFTFDLGQSTTPNLKNSLQKEVKMSSTLRDQNEMNLQKFRTRVMKLVIKS
jgi:hypothetical protein